MMRRSERNGNGADSSEGGLRWCRVAYGKPPRPDLGAGMRGDGKGCGQSGTPRLCPVRELPKIDGMERVAVCIAATMLWGCLIPNPEYQGQAATDSAGAEGTSGGLASRGGQSSTSGASTTGIDSASGEAGDATSLSTTEPGTSSATSAGSSSTTGEPGEACPMGDTLRICLEFDVDGPAGVSDQSLHGYPVNVAGGDIVEGPWSGAFRFDVGATVEVDCDGGCAGGSAVTYQAWVRLDELPGAGDRAGVVDNNGILGMFITETAELRCVSSSGTTEGGSVPLGEWSHLACVADGDLLLAYIDGASVAELSIRPLPPTDDPVPLAIGNNAPQLNDGLVGLMDKVRVWDEARTAEQLAASATP